MGDASQASLLLAAERAAKEDMLAVLAKTEAALAAERAARRAAATAPRPLDTLPTDVASLTRSVESLRSARAKLIAQVDAAQADADRSTADALALGQALLAARADADAWEAASQDAVARADALATLLEEGATWDGKKRGGEGGNDAAQLLVAERAKNARLEARVTALCMELGRARRALAELATAGPAALAAVEARLASVEWGK